MKARILLVDDNINLTTLLGKALTRNGYECHVQNNAVIATETARGVQPDLVLLDVMMPGKDGGDVLAELRADRLLREVPVIMLTALAAEAEGIAGMGGINSPVLGKPVDLGNLLVTIQQELVAAQQSQVALLAR